MQDEWSAPWWKSVSCPLPIAPKEASRSASTHAIKRRPASASTTCRVCWLWTTSVFGIDGRSVGVPLGRRHDQAEAPHARLISASSLLGRDRVVSHQRRTTTVETDWHRRPRPRLRGANGKGLFVEQESTRPLPDRSPARSTMPHNRRFTVAGGALDVLMTMVSSS
jgi:hypothetical protein